MKKITVLGALTFIALVAFCQPRIHQKEKGMLQLEADTVRVPVLYYQASDTVKTTFVYAKRHNLKTQDGYVVYQGWKNSTGTWVKTPIFHLYTLKWKPFKEKVISANP